MKKNILFFDIETEVNPEAVNFIQVPNAPSNYKDQEKIAAYVAEKQAESLKTAALDPDYGRIIAIATGWFDLEPEVMDKYDHSEKEILEHFWTYYKECGGNSCGYNIIGFDLPYIMRRSFDLGVKAPIIPSLAKYRTEPTIDLMGILFNWGQAKGLKWVCKRYGINNPLPDLDGSQVANMDPETLRKYAGNDVSLVVELYKRMCGVYMPALNSYQPAFFNR